MNTDIRINKDLVGNLIILLADNIKPLYFTKLLKLLYLIDEEYTKEYGSPLTWLKYEVWKFGPVPTDIYFSKNIGENRYSKYVSFEYAGENKKTVHAKAKFSDLEFSDSELKLINKVIKKYQDYKIDQLIEEVHKNGSLWKKAIDKHNLRFSESNKTSDIQLDFSDLLNDNMKMHYIDSLESLKLKSLLLE